MPSAPATAARLESAARRLYSKVDIFRPAVGYVDMGLARRRVDHFERFARQGLAQVSSDDCLVLYPQGVEQVSVVCH